MLQIFFKDFRSDDAFSVWRSKPNILRLTTRAKQNRVQTPDALNKMLTFFKISTLDCDFARWKIKSQPLLAHWNYRGAFMQVRGPSSKSSCLVLGARVHLFCYHMKQISLWHAGAQEFTAAVKSHAPKTASKHQPSPRSCCNPRCDLSGACHNHKISTFQSCRHTVPCFWVWYYC